jgi:signal transduction histidine kinase
VIEKLKEKSSKNFIKSVGIRYALAGAIFILGIAFTLVAFRATQNFEERRKENEFERQVNSQITELQHDLDLTVESIQSMGAHIGALNVITHSNFKQYAQDMRNRRSGIVFIGWMSHVLKNERSLHTNTLHRQGFDSFEIVEKNAQGKVIPAKERDRYFPVSYGEPTDVLLPMLGVDLSTYWLAAMEESRDKGTAIATFPLLSNETQDKSAYVSIIQPVYHAGLPNQMVARRANLRGFIFTIVHIQDIVIKALSELNTIDIVLSDKKPEESTVLTPEITMAGKSWSIILTQKQQFETTNQAKGVLITGVIFTLFVVAYLLTLAGRTARIEKLVAERTRELEESEAHLVQSEKMASIGQMVAGIVHEINTPLAYVHSSVELIKENMNDVKEAVESYQKLINRMKSGEFSEDSDSDGELLQTAEEWTETLEEDGTLVEVEELLNNGLDGLDKISSLVKNLKDFSRLDRAKVAEQDINAGLDDTLKMVNHMLKDKIRIDRKYGDIPHIKCSPAQINQVFLNLLVNGIQAVQSAEREQGIIEIVTQLSGKMVEIVVKDNGNGIDQEHIDKIFDPFFTTKRSGKGTGLGLAISRKIIREHRGKISVHSELERGTEFTILLPIE